MSYTYFESWPFNTKSVLRKSTRGVGGLERSRPAVAGRTSLLAPPQTREDVKGDSHPSFILFFGLMFIVFFPITI